MGKKYWEVHGKVRLAILDIHEKRVAAHKAMLAFAKKHGTKQYASRDSFGIYFVLMFDAPPDLKVWKPVRNSPKCYSPKVSSKVGKELDKQMREIAKTCPSGVDLNEAIGFENWFSGSSWKTSGYSIFDGNCKLVLVVTDECYEPPKELAKSIKRISDVVYEKLTKKS